MSAKTHEKTNPERVEPAENDGNALDELTADQPTPVASWGQIVAWSKRFLAGNPAYILSAVLLLYGISLISGDTRFLSGETPKLAFNFGALELYELLLAVTAAALAGRAIWYDSTLLIFLENLLVFVPFILVSQAIFIGPGYAWAICLIGGLLAAGRAVIIKKRIPSLNAPSALAWMGLLFLLLHVVSPIALRSLYQDGDPRTSEPIFQNVLRGAWLFLMPALALLGLVLPQDSIKSNSPPEKRWLPLLFLGLWVAATGVHLKAIGYVYSIRWEWLLTAPVLWALAWTAQLRRSDFSISGQGAPASILLVLPIVSTGFALTQPYHPAFALLTLANLIFYFRLWLRDKANRVVLELCLVSVVTLLIGLYHLQNGPVFSDRYDRAWKAGVIGFVMLQALLFRDPRMGAISAIGAALSAYYGAQEWKDAAHWSLQAGLVFFMLHSLRWKEHPGEGVVFCLYLAAITWLSDIWVWLADGQSAAVWGGTSMAVFILIACGIARWLLGRWSSKMVPIIAACGLVSAQGYSFIEWCRSIPAGVTVLCASFLLFGIGTIVAWTKPRWQSKA